MFRLSKLADYGTVMMVYLARHPEQLCNARDIALHTHIALPTVSKLLKRLTGAGLLVSMRGTAGGYRLKKRADAISVAEIIYALEEQRGFTECSLHPNECSLQAVCGVQGNWQLISHAIEEALESLSLEVLAKPKLKPSEIDFVRQIVSGVSRG